MPSFAIMSVGRMTQCALVRSMQSPVIGPATSITAERGRSAVCGKHRRLDRRLDVGEVGGRNRRERSRPAHPASGISAKRAFVPPISPISTGNGSGFGGCAVGRHADRPFLECRGIGITRRHRPRQSPTKMDALRLPPCQSSAATAGGARPVRAFTTGSTIMRFKWLAAVAAVALVGQAQAQEVRAGAGL